MSKFSLDQEMSKILNDASFQQCFTPFQKKASVNVCAETFEKLAQIAQELDKKNYHGTAKLLRAGLEALQEESSDIEIEQISQRYGLGVDK